MFFLRGYLVMFYLYNYYTFKHFKTLLEEESLGLFFSGKIILKLNE